MRRRRAVGSSSTTSTRSAGAALGGGAVIACHVVRGAGRERPSSSRGRRRARRCRPVRRRGSRADGSQSVAVATSPARSSVSPASPAPKSAREPFARVAQPDARRRSASSAAIVHPRARPAGATARSRPARSAPRARSITRSTSVPPCSAAATSTAFRVRAAPRRGGTRSRRAAAARTPAPADRAAPSARRRQRHAVAVAAGEDLAVRAHRGHLLA